MSLFLINLLPYLRYPSFSIHQARTGYCFVCGNKATFEKRRILAEELVRLWNINNKTREAFDLRESLNCSVCNNTLRTRQLAKALLKVYGVKGVKSLKELVETRSFNLLKIAEINSCGDLHNFFEKMESVSYSEYSPIKQNVNIEDIQNLTYGTESFDLVLTSDTLEHVPDLKKALHEVRRILKKGGYHIFTVPCILNRKTRERVIFARGKEEKKLPLSFHGDGKPDYLVYRELGSDFIKELETLNFSVKLYLLNPIKEDYSFVFVTRKE